ncbi:LamG domain-containing protein [Amycolatopsis sp. CA-126428]|uniref:LamG domain-containing protein n=1 Tax=Amycolatopsis sp. CA-126428 TaxID=2073158 RepID=UPI0011AFE142|nr:LamG domain-containing protein [Amycolatopsis sp. CA-126428]
MRISTFLGKSMLFAAVLALAASAMAVVPAGTAEAATAIEDTFATAAPNSAPPGWTVDSGGGTATVQDLAPDRALRIRDTSTLASTGAARAFTATTDTVVIGARLRAEQTSATIGLNVTGPGGTAFTFGLGAGGQFYTYNGTTKAVLGDYAANTWYDVRAIVRPSTATLYVDGVRKGTGYAFRTATAKLDSVRVGVSTPETGTVWVDDVRVTTEANGTTWPQIGSVAPRSASAIGASNIGIGAETQDRDYVDYSSYRKYLGPLGATKVRMQAGWAKVEPTPGARNWGWLDTAVDDALSRGVRPWLQLSYGNGAYSGGGGSGLGGVLPTSTAALAAWDKWVTDTVTRYRDRVTDWEIWNEPNSSISAADYATFFVRTAKLVRAAQASSFIYGGVSASIDVPFLTAFMTDVNASGRIDLLDGVTYHPYQPNPDDPWVAKQMATLQTAADSYHQRITLRQGENGAPSTASPSFGALGDLDWTELSQSKWLLRRALNDLGRGVSTSLFTISDALYFGNQHNTKGLLQTNTDKTIRYAKPSYYAVQSLTSTVDATLHPIANFRYSDTTSTSVNVQAFAKQGTGKQAVALWFQDAVPGNDNTRTPVTMTFAAGDFTDPVYVDLRTGAIHDIPDAAWSRNGTSYTFTGVPVYDSPVLIIDRSLVHF